MDELAAALLSLVPPKECHNLAAGAVVAGAEQTTADTAGDAVFQRPCHCVIAIAAGEYVAGNFSCALGSGRTGRTPQEGHCLCAGAGCVGAELTVAGAAGDALLHGPFHCLGVVCVGGNVREGGSRLDFRKLSGDGDLAVRHGEGVLAVALAVGYGQLAWKLRNDPRVVNLERTNMRKVTREQVPDEIDFFSVDVSFISLKLILPVARQLMSENAQAVCLIKPQFEAGREKVGKKGVVRDPAVHVEVVRKIFDFCLENGFDVLNLDYSPIKGPEGNIEYLIHLRKSYDPKSYTDVTPEQLVENSHAALDKK